MRVGLSAPGTIAQKIVVAKQVEDTNIFFNITPLYDRVPADNIEHTEALQHKCKLMLDTLAEGCRHRLNKPKGGLFVCCTLPGICLLTNLSEMPPTEGLFVRQRNPVRLSKPLMRWILDLSEDIVKGIKILSQMEETKTEHTPFRRQVRSADCDKSKRCAAKKLNLTVIRVATVYKVWG